MCTSTIAYRGLINESAFDDLAIKLAMGINNNHTLLFVSSSKMIVNHSRQSFPKPFVFWSAIANFFSSFSVDEYSGNRSREKQVALVGSSCSKGTLVEKL